MNRTALEDTNPVCLKIDLLCRGLRLNKAFRIGKNGKSAIRTRAGAIGGLDLKIAGRFWVNAPIHEPFAKTSPYVLDVEDNHVFVKHIEKGFRVLVDPAPQPKFYSMKTKSNRKMTEIAVLQGDHLAISPAPMCAFWTSERECRYCAAGCISRNFGPARTLKEILEVVDAAVREIDISFFHMNVGFFSREDRGARLIIPIVKALKNAYPDINTSLKICPPENDKWALELYSSGLDAIGYNLEVFDDNIFAKCCPGKYEVIGRRRYYEGLQYVSEIFAKGHVLSNLIAGLEPPESAIKGVEYLTSIGVIPQLPVFRPLQGSHFEHHLPPDPADVKKIAMKQAIQTKRHGIPTRTYSFSNCIMPDEANSLL